MPRARRWRRGRAALALGVAPMSRRCGRVEDASESSVDASRRAVASRRHSESFSFRSLGVRKKKKPLGTNEKVNEKVNE